MLVKLQVSHSLNKKTSSHKGRIASSEVVHVTRLQLDCPPIRRHVFRGADSRDVGTERRQVHRLQRIQGQHQRQSQDKAAAGQLYQNEEEEDFV